ncbi:MAG: patatin-like phospholipase family protein, partial [Flammeovirgaceae bacterium]
MRERLRWLPKPLHQPFFGLIFSFPIHLLIYNIKKNQVLLSFWLLIWAVISGNMWKRFGANYLFLDPEYLNQVNGTSFMIVGMSFGGFIIAYNITCYILDGYRYSFLGLLRHPLLKYSLNNSIIPLLFGLYYLIKIINFQLNYEQDS